MFHRPIWAAIKRLNSSHHISHWVSTSSRLLKPAFNKYSVIASSWQLASTRTMTSSADDDTSKSACFITCGSKEEATKLARMMVEQKLCACVNIIPGVTSVYEWEGKVEEDQEHLLMAKTMTSKVDKVSAFIRDNHSYDVAEVISFRVDNGNPPYLDWIEKAIN